MTEKYKSLEHTISETRLARQVENLIFEMELDEVIVNSNSCGQGYDDDHHKHDYHTTILKHGYSYSHSTPIRKLDGSTVNHHTYKHMNNPDKNVSVSRQRGLTGSHLQWATSTSGSGRKAVSGFSVQTLDKHLKGRKVAKKTTPDDLGHRPTVAEEVLTEQAPIEEISKEKLEKYTKKAIDDHGMANVAKRNTTNPVEKQYFARTEKNRKKGISTAINKLDKMNFGAVTPEDQNDIDRHAGKKPLAKEEVEIVELAPMVDPNKAKMDAQKMQLQKQRDALKLQIQKQKADKQMQAAKQKGQEEVQKIKEDELTERQSVRVNTFGRASKLQNLHNRQYQRLSAAGNLAAAEAHRKRAIEYKRISYLARDNPHKLPH